MRKCFHIDKSHFYFSKQATEDLLKMKCKVDFECEPCEINIYYVKYRSGKFVALKRSIITALQKAANSIVFWFFAVIGI